MCCVLTSAENGICSLRIERNIVINEFPWFARIIKTELEKSDRSSCSRRSLKISFSRTRLLARSHLRRKRVVQAHAVTLHKICTLRLGAQNKLVAAIRHVRSRRPTSLSFSLISIGTVWPVSELDFFEQVTFHVRISSPWT